MEGDDGGGRGASVARMLKSIEAMNDLDNVVQLPSNPAIRRRLKSK